MAQTIEVKENLVSIIMPVYNGEKYIAEAIESVLSQSYDHWELLIINDGSIDNTASIISKYKDKRIRYFEQQQSGVSAARNTGIKNINGDFLCFLDSDDMLSVDSIAKRISLFIRDQELTFIDGTVMIMDSQMKEVLEVRKHSFKGEPFEALLRLDEDVFFGPSWMIRLEDSKKYAFLEELTHGEDLFFYICISKGGYYTAIDDVVLLYRKSSGSAMSNLKGLENGYGQLLRSIRRVPGVTKEHFQI
ncbi:MAG: glycosyltransferase family A protein, partial [Bacteroidota bacterium]